MKQILKWTGFVLLAAGVGLALVFAFNTGIQAQSPPTVAQRAFVQENPYSSDDGNSSDVQYDYHGWGMGSGMMGRGSSANTGNYSNNSVPLTSEQAVEAARQYLTGYENPDLILTEIMEFTDNFYVEVEENGADVRTFELLIDRYTGVVYPEPGPNMMWNTKYGHMGGMMSGWRSWQGELMPVTSEQALDLAQEWLDQYIPGTSTAEDADAFFGYYTIHVLKDARVYGMLSVNGNTGEVWYHTWHGNFIEMKKLED